MTRTNYNIFLVGSYLSLGFANVIQGNTKMAFLMLAFAAIFTLFQKYEL